MSVASETTALVEPPMSVASETTALVEPTPSVSSASPTITDKEKSDNSGMMMTQVNAEKKPAWSKLSNGGESGIKPVMGASSWPSLSEATSKASPSSSKLSSDWLTSVEDESLSSSSSSVPSSQESDLTVGIRLVEKILDSSFVLTSGDIAQRQNSSSHAEFTRGQNEKNKFESQSHGGNQNQYQQNPQNNQSRSHHLHQNQGGRRNQEHVNQNSDYHRNFNGRGRFAQAATSAFVRPPPPPDVRLYAQYLPVYHQPFYLFGGHVHFPVAPPMMYHPHRMPFMEPPPILSASLGNRVQETPLKTRILNQVNYYLSEENLLNDEFLRKRMNDEGFVHIQLVAGFNKLKTLTTNIQLILDSLQGSDVVELKGYEIRNRHVWRRFILPHHLRVPFYPSPE